MIRRINLIGGPGSGKSTLAAQIFGDLKVKGYDIEHVSEYIKTWAYMDRKPTSYDQLYVFSKQLHAEDLILQHVSTTVTDSPLLMNAAYAAFYGCNFSPILTSLSQHFDRTYPSLNLFIERTVQYQQSGRYQNYRQAVDFDCFVLDFMTKHLEGDVIKIRVDRFDEIISTIERKAFNKVQSDNTPIQIVPCPTPIDDRSFCRITVDAAKDATYKFFHSWDWRRK